MTPTPHHRSPSRPIALQRGQSAIEYLVLLAVFVLAIFVPVDGDDPAIVVIADAVRTAYSTFSAAVSLP